MNPNILGSIISGGSSLVGGIVDSVATGIQNKKSRQFSRETYELQKKDNLHFWNMQNEYNSPQSQMKRLQEAGLNPNLVYGSGQAQQPAGNISTPDVQAPQFRVPEIGNAVANAGNKIAQFQDYEIKQAQIDNLKLHNNVIAEEIPLKQAQTQATLAGYNERIFDLNFKNDMRDTQADYRREELRRIRTNTQFTLDQNDRNAAQTGANLRESTERVLTARLQRTKTEAERQQIRQAIINMQQDSELKAKEMKMRALGIAPNSPAWMYLIGTTIDNYMNLKK